MHGYPNDLIPPPGCRLPPPGQGPPPPHDMMYGPPPPDHMGGVPPPPPHDPMELPPDGLVGPPPPPGADWRGDGPPPPPPDIYPKESGEPTEFTSYLDTSDDSGRHTGGEPGSP